MAQAHERPADPDHRPARWPPQSRFVTARKPAGGYVLLTVCQLLLVWRAYRTKAIAWFDLRVWFVAVELQAQRCMLSATREPHFTVEEFQPLVGDVRPTRLRTSLTRLETIGLLTWTPTALTLIQAPAQLRVKDRSSYQTLLHSIPNYRRRVPVPRRTLRYIANRARCSRAATILGVLLWCLYFREGQCHSGGACKASWIAQIFGVSLRSVKCELQHLQELGWLMRQPYPPWYAQRYGGWTLINLEWLAPPTSHACVKPLPSPVSPALVSDQKRSPLPPTTDQKLSPPDSYQKLPTGSGNHQKPARCGPTGVLHSEASSQPQGTVETPALCTSTEAEDGSSQRVTEVRTAIVASLAAASASLAESPPALEPWERPTLTGGGDRLHRGRDSAGRAQQHSGPRQLSSDPAHADACDPAGPQR